MIFNLLIFQIILALIVISLNSYTFSFQVRTQSKTHKFNTNNLYSHLEELRSLKKSNVETVRGAQCYLPSEQRIQRWIQNKWENTAKKFGFQEYSMPVLTHTLVFVNTNTPMDNEHYKEMYTFNDKKGRNLSLRGDITPQFMHMIKSLRNKNSSLPLSTLKWYTIADCWRYERPSYCRRRNHLQWNVDVIGISTLEAELDIISVLIYFLKSVGLREHDVKISLNHRKFIPDLLKHLGIVNYSLEWFYKFSKVLDKYKKTPRSEFNKMLIDLDMTTVQCRELHRLIESTKRMRDLEKFVKSESLIELKKLLKGLKDRDLLDWIDIDLTIVRGNDYYTGIVFECFDKSAMLPRSLAGGGRYDNYFNDSDPVLKYSAGFGMGNIAIANLLKQKNLLPEPSRLVDVLVFTEGINVLSKERRDENGEFERKHDTSETVKKTGTNEQRRCLYNLMDLLRDNEFSVYHYYKTPKVKRALRFAEKWSIPFFLIPIHLDGKPMIMLKNLHLRSQEHFSVDDPQLAESVLKIIRRQNV